MADLPPNPPKLPRTLFKLLLGAILLCFAFLAGYGLGIKSPADGGYGAGYDDGYGAARQTLADSGLLPAVPVTTFLMGKVTGIGADYIEFDTVQVVVNPLEEQAPLSRRAFIGSDTKLYRVDPETLTRSDATLTEVVAGDGISVMTGEDITYADSFTATEITVTAQPAEAGAEPETEE
jgi:hypothetical protein